MESGHRHAGDEAIGDRQRDGLGSPYMRVSSEAPTGAPFAFRCAHGLPRVTIAGLNSYSVIDLPAPAVVARLDS